MFGKKLQVMHQSDEANLSGGSVPPAPAPQAPVADQVDKTQTAEFWKSKYDGQSGYVQQLKQQYDSTRLKVSDFQTQIEALEAERKSLELARTTETAERDRRIAELESRNKAFEAEKQTRTMLRQKFPDLVQDFDMGALRLDGLEGEALENYLNVYAQRVNAVRDRTIDEVVSGSTPQPKGPADSAKLDEKTIVEELFKAPVGSPEYEKLMAQYNELVKGRGVSSNEGFPATPVIPRG